MATKTVWLVNKTKHPIHIMRPGKDADGNQFDNIRLSTMGAVGVDDSVLKLRGVAHLIKKRSLAQVSEEEAKRLNKQHDEVVAEKDEEKEEDGDDD